MPLVGEKRDDVEVEVGRESSERPKYDWVLWCVDPGVGSIVCAGEVERDMERIEGSCTRLPSEGTRARGVEDCMGNAPTLRGVRSQCEDDDCACTSEGSEGRGAYSGRSPSADGGGRTILSSVASYLSPRSRSRSRSRGSCVSLMCAGQGEGARELVERREDELAWRGKGWSEG
jgi:hypothetical protein